MLKPVRDQLEIFVEAMFRYASSGTVALRSFYEDRSEAVSDCPADRLTAVISLVLIDIAEKMAGQAANATERVVFCPPIATFRNGRRATEADLEEGLALSVECDTNPQQARARLEQILGPATVVIRSGGVWTDPQTGAQADKLHLHWRLAEPATGKALTLLKQARAAATRLAGGDSSNVPIVHPIRWPGSWHRKAEPRLCTIEATDPDRELVLELALDALETAAPAAADSAANGGTDSNSERRRIEWEDAFQPDPQRRQLSPHADAIGGQHGRLGGAGAGHRQRAALPADQFRSRPTLNAPGDVTPSSASCRKPCARPTPNTVRAAVSPPRAGDSLVRRRPGARAGARLAGRRAVASNRHRPDQRPMGLLQDFCRGRSGRRYHGRPGIHRLSGRTPRRRAVRRRRGRQRDPDSARGRTKEKYPDCGKLPFAWIDECPRLLGPNAVEALAAIADAVAERMQKEFAVPLALIVVDTVIDAAGYAKPGDENDATLGQLVMRRMGELARRTGALVLGVDHFGKAVETGTRGRAPRKAAPTWCWRYSATSRSPARSPIPGWRCARIAPGRRGQEHPFTVKVVELGGSEQEVSSLVIQWGGQKAAEPDESWSKSLRLLRRVLMDLLASDQAKNERPFVDGPVVRAIDLELIRGEFHRQYPATGDEEAKRRARKEAFRRAIVRAQEQGRICIRDSGGVTLVWLATSTSHDA